MAEFELQMKYSTAPMKVGMHFFAILFPVWGVMIPALTALFIVLLLRLPANFPLLYCLGLISLLVGVVAVSLFLSLLCDDDQIKVTKHGISFPLRFWPALKFQQHHMWQDLGALRINWQRQAKFQEGETLNLFFAAGHMLNSNCNI